jgi:tRNA-2-methylthio-N6-dimethylallyladenosine synthase
LLEEERFRSGRHITLGHTSPLQGLVGENFSLSAAILAGGPKKRLWILGYTEVSYIPPFPKEGKDGAPTLSPMSSGSNKTFYLETFGCQMNVHDSEKVVGTLMAEGYRQVESVEEADLILYNTCSIRDKAEQKVFHRLSEFKKLQSQGKKFGVLGCVAQQEGEKIFERAPHVSLVAGSASYRNLGSMLVQLETGNQRVTGLDDRQTDQTFDTDLTARGDANRGFITIIEGCDKFCAYCVVPFTRGKERSRTSYSVVEEARRMADLGYTSIQLLGQNVNSYRDPDRKKSFAELLVAVAEVAGIKRVWFTTSHPRDFTKDIVEAIEAVPGLCNHVHLPVQSGSTKVLDAMQRLYTREQYLERISWMKAAKRDISITTDIIVGFPGETREDFEETISLVGEVRYDGAFTYKYSPRPNTAAISMPDVIADEEKSLRLSILMDRVREIQKENNKRHIGQVLEVMVEGRNEARKQWTGRTSQNKVVNFTSPSDTTFESGSYANIRVAQTTPNSLVGEYIETTYVPELRTVAEVSGPANLVQIAGTMVAPVTSGV